MQVDGNVGSGVTIGFSNLQEIPTSSYLLKQPVGLVNLISKEGLIAIQQAQVRS